MKVVYYPGVWDLFHFGHLQALKAAKGKDRRLIVGVPYDDVVEEDKGFPPIVPAVERAAIIRSLQIVDQVIVYHSLGFISELQRVNPDFLAIGTQWGGQARHREAEEWITKHNKSLLVIPYTYSVSTTQIVEKVIERYERTRSVS